MKIRFPCPSCERPSQVELPGYERWQCPGCDHLLPLPPNVPAPAAGQPLTSCLICGNHELYKQKAFPHWLGLTLLVAAFAAFLFFNGQRQYVWAWACLLGTALIDVVLYLWVGDVVVCYRCHAHHSCPNAGEGVTPHELIVAERYRQERLRLGRMRDEG